MKTIAIITDKSLGLTVSKENTLTKKREAARAIIFNASAQIALIYTETHGHHKIAGGGIDSGETFHDALKREAIEEAGCEVKIREEVVGKIEEYINEECLHQISYCGVADVVNDLGANQLTDSEKSEGYTAPIWVTLPEALALFKADKPKTYSGNFMHARDMLFIETALKMFP